MLYARALSYKYTPQQFAQATARLKQSFESPCTVSTKRPDSLTAIRPLSSPQLFCHPNRTGRPRGSNVRSITGWISRRPPATPFSRRIDHACGEVCSSTAIPIRNATAQVMTGFNIKPRRPAGTPIFSVRVIVLDTGAVAIHSTVGDVITAFPSVCFSIIIR
jgi:hypothetical protein